MVLYPEDLNDAYRQAAIEDPSSLLKPRSPEYIKQIKYVSASTDGMIKIWKEQGKWLD